MKLLIVFAALASACLAAQAPAPKPPPHPQAALKDGGCDAKGCPQKDQNGDAPTSCEYMSGMATGWRCILTCHYPNSQWGALVDSSNCN
jgi:hypothetical protein